MNNSISIVFGTPEHGWLPVDFHYQDFHLAFSASDVLNDPIDELYNAIMKLNENEPRRVIWWLEPGAYFFDFEKSGQHIILTISSTENLHNANADKKIILKTNTVKSLIIEPFRVALRQFCSKTYEENHWPYKLDRHKIEVL